MDIFELIQQAITKIRGYFFKMARGSSNNSKKGSGKPRRVISLFVLLIIVIWGIASSLFVVDETEQGVVLRLGKYQRTENSGLKLKIPFRIETSTTVPTQIIQNMNFGFRTQQAGIVSQFSRDYPEESTMLTGDLNIIDVEWIIQYRIDEPEDWLFNVDQRSKTIRDISQSVVNQLVGDYYINDVLGSVRTEIEELALIRHNAVFEDYKLGITVIAVRLQNIVPPAGSVQDAFEDVNKAVQDMNRLINEGREEYNRTIPKARGEAEQMVQIARGYATERVNEAKGDVARFSAILTEYNASPRVTRERLYYETVESILAEGSTPAQIIDSNFENLLPLLQIDQNNPLGGIQ